MIFVNIEDIEENSFIVEMKMQGDGCLIANQIAAMLKEIEKTAPECLMHAIGLMIEKDEKNE